MRNWYKLLSAVVLTASLGAACGGNGPGGGGQPTFTSVCQTTQCAPPT